MKKYIALLLLFLSFYTSYGQGFDVDNYSVDIYINKAGYFDVVEKYDVNFTEYKHGIYRNIILNYKIAGKNKNLENRTIEISNIQVAEAPFETSGEFFGDLNIKIGNPDYTVIGQKSYTISYRVKYAFLFDDTKSYFYWNIRPSDWRAPFKHVSFRVYLPSNLPLDSTNCFVYTGKSGFSNLSEIVSLNYKNSVLSGETRDGITMYGNENLTVLIDLPKNYVFDATTTWSYWWDHWGWIFYILLFVLAFYLIWKIYGEETYTPSIVEYLPPQDIDSAMAGFLLKDGDSEEQLISLIPYFGNLGFLKLEELPLKNPKKKPEIIITKLKELPDDAPSYQKWFFNGLFMRATDNKIRLSILAVTFYPVMEKATEKLTEEAEKYYSETSAKMKKRMHKFLVFSLVIGFFIFVNLWTFVAGLSFVIAISSLLILNKYMSKKNAVGNKLEAKLLGYKKFIKAVDEDKLKTLLEQDPSYFEKTMSYALSFGMLDKWSKKFESLNVHEPNWYICSSTVAISGAFYWSHNISSSMSNLQSSIGAPPSVIISSGGASGGGGSSGGGFGGGGGGSW